MWRRRCCCQGGSTDCAERGWKGRRGGRQRLLRGFATAALLWPKLNSPPQPARLLLRACLAGGCRADWHAVVAWRAGAGFSAWEPKASTSARLAGRQSRLSVPLTAAFPRWSPLPTCLPQDGRGRGREHRLASPGCLRNAAPAKMQERKQRASYITPQPSRFCLCRYPLENWTPR